MHVADADDLSSAGDLELDLAGAVLARVGGLEDVAELLQRLACRLDEEEVYEDHLDYDPADVYDLGTD